MNPVILTLTTCGMFINVCFTSLAGYIVEEEMEGFDSDDSLEEDEEESKSKSHS